ncbi:hypothetical protein R3P38DRAFT_3354924 [Favolaschia claudopus]|uniref:Uncharacterized protein n=1 Tax=Favolaschia claudopus TaxID=2862362 RepID=A0AAW0BMN6_9AGAR
MDQQYTVPPPRYTPAQQQPQYIFPSHDPLPASSSSPSLPAMQPASPTWSELELKTFGHRIAPSHLRQHSPSSPSLLVQHLPHDSLSVNNNSLWSPAPELPVTASDSFIPDDDPDSPVEVQATTFRQPTAAFSVAVQPPASRRRAPAPTPAPIPGPASQPPDDTIPDAIEFEVMVWLPAPPEKSAGARKAKKAPKPEQPSFGPITAHTDMDYDDFLEVLAEKLSATPNFLVLSSMEWRYVKPANSVWLPLRDLDGYKSLIKKILKPAKGVSATYIIPSATQPTATSSRYTGAAEEADEPKLSDDEGLPKKNVPFDEGLEEVVEEIQNKYPPGLCADHPNLPCYHHRRTGNHYELDRPKLLVWAAAKKTRSCTLDLPPLGSNLFKADKAIKRASPIAPPAVATGTPTPTLPPPAAPPQTPYPHPYGYYPPPPPMPLPPFGILDKTF